MVLFLSSQLRFVFILLFISFSWFSAEKFVYSGFEYDKDKEKGRRDMTGQFLSA